MPRTHRPYPPEFRAEAVRLARGSDKAIPALAADLGVSSEALRHWLRQADAADADLANAAHVKAVPGRKTDVRDSEWLLELLQHGLVRASFIPPAPIRELRELTRHRANLVEERARAANRVQQVQEGANITDELAGQGGWGGSFWPWCGVRSRGTAPHTRNHSAGTTKRPAPSHGADARGAGLPRHRLGSRTPARG